MNQLDNTGQQKETVFKFFSEHDLMDKKAEEENATNAINNLARTEITGGYEILSLDSIRGNIIRKRKRKTK